VVIDESLSIVHTLVPYLPRAIQHIIANAKLEHPFVSSAPPKRVNCFPAFAGAINTGSSHATRTYIGMLARCAPVKSVGERSTQRPPIPSSPAVGFYTDSTKCSLYTQQTIALIITTIAHLSKLDYKLVATSVLVELLHMIKNNDSVLIKDVAASSETDIVHHSMRVWAFVAAYACGYKPSRADNDAVYPLFIQSIDSCASQVFGAKCFYEDEILSNLSVADFPMNNVLSVEHLGVTTPPTSMATPSKHILRKTRTTKPILEDRVKKPQTARERLYPKQLDLDTNTVYSIIFRPQQD
jgi:hypothetical protein